MNPKVSIIIPIYNVEKYIEECLSSVFAQDYDNYEIIIVDDCTTDKSVDICKELSSKRKRDIKLISHSYNRGISAARNTGIDLSQGDYLFFIDSDDYLVGRDAISSLVNVAQRSEADVISANNVVFDDNTKAIIPHSDKLYDDNDRAPSVNGTAWNKLVKTNFLKENNLYFEEGILHEDDVWTFKLMSLSPVLATISQSTYAYRVREGSIMTKISRKHIYSRIKISVILYDYLKQQYSAYIMERMIPLEYNALIISYLCLTKKDAYKFLVRYYKKRYTLGSSFKNFLRPLGKKHKLMSFSYLLPYRIALVYIKLLIYIDVKYNRAVKKLRNHSTPTELTDELFEQIKNLCE